LSWEPMPFSTYDAPTNTAAGVRHADCTLQEELLQSLKGLASVQFGLAPWRVSAARPVDLLSRT
jgi:hypothetical protein